MREAPAAAAATVADLAVWMALPVSLAIPAHLALSVLLAGHAWRGRHGGALGIRMPLAALTATMGPMGAAAVLAGTLLTGLFRPGGQPGDWFTAEAGWKPAPESAGAAAGFEETVEVTPLMDILEMGGELEKQEVVSLVTRSFRPALAPVLKRALGDPSNAIRVQAATAMARIEGRFLDRAMELDRLVAARPSDAGPAGELARLYDDYAFTGLLDPVRERENQQLARRWYERWIALEPGNSSAHFALGRLLVRRGEWEQAGEHLDLAGSEASAWRLETLFRLGRYDEIPELAASLDSRDPLMPLSLRQAALLWTGEGATG